MRLEAYKKFWGGRKGLAERLYVSTIHVLVVTFLDFLDYNLNQNPNPKHNPNLHEGHEILK